MRKAISGTNSPVYYPQSYIYSLKNEVAKAKEAINCGKQPIYSDVNSLLEALKN